jgi:hypothetical protein
MILKKWTEAYAVRATEIRYRRIDAILLEIATLWGDVDQSNVARVDELRNQVEAARREVREASQARLEELRTA